MAIYQIQNCKDDGEVLLVTSSSPLIVGQSYVFVLTPLSEGTSPIDGYCRCYRVVELLQEGHYLVLYEATPKIQYADCQDCLKEHHDREVKKIREQYIVEWKERTCSTEKIQSDFCSFATHSYKRYLWEVYGTECYDKLQEAYSYVRHEMDRIDLLKEPCLCASSICYPVCLLDMEMYGEYPMLTCIIPSIESLDISSCMVVDIVRVGLNGYQPSCVLPSITVESISLDSNNAGCSYNSWSISINSIIPS